jgi:hypothetical protein
MNQPYQKLPVQTSFCLFLFVSFLIGLVMPATGQVNYNPTRLVALVQLFKKSEIPASGSDPDTVIQRLSNRKIVFVWYPGWLTGIYGNYDYSSLTHIAFDRFLLMEDTFNRPQVVAFKQENEAWELVQFAHARNQNCKIVLTVNTSIFPKNNFILLKDKEYQLECIKAILNKMVDLNADWPLFRCQ